MATSDTNTNEQSSTTASTSFVGGSTSHLQVDEQLIERYDGIACLRQGAGTDHWNGLNYQVGINRNTVGSRELSMNVATVPPGGVAAAHIHVGFEVGLFILQGRVLHKYGLGLRHELTNGAGDFIFIDAGLPHEVYNLSDSEPIIAVVARSSANQWDEIIPYDPATDPDANASTSTSA